WTMNHTNQQSNSWKLTPLKLKQTLVGRFYSMTPLMRLNILTFCVGIIGGLGSWIFRIAINVIFELLFVLPQRVLRENGFDYLDWLPFLLAPVLAGLVVGTLTSKVSQETKGHGVPEVLEAVALRDGKMNLRVPFVKILASAGTLGSGGSAGREGPIAQIGAGFASFLGQKLDLNPREFRTLVVSGVAAGISATFNAPIGGTLFAFEVVMRDASISVFIPIIIASVVGTVVGQFFLGDETAFANFPQLEYHDPILIPFFVLVGILAGFASAIWIKLFYKSEDVLEETFKRLKIPDFTQAAIGGLFVGIILLVTYLSVEDWEKYTIMGRLYTPMTAVFTGDLTKITEERPLIIIVLILTTLLILKVFSTIFTIGTGGSGGVFAPTLFIGVMLGGLFGLFVHEILGVSEVIAIFALLGMAAFFGGTGRAPLTAIIMTAEMTGDYLLFIPLMLAVTSGLLVSNKLEPNDIYIRKLLRRGVKLEKPDMEVLDTIKVSQVMVPRDKLITLDIKTRIETVLDYFLASKHEGYPVFNGEDFIGVITVADVEKALRTLGPKDWVVGDIIENNKRELICVDPDATLAHAIALMVRKDVSRIPVVEKGKDKPQLIGWITHHDITGIYMENRASRILEEAEEHLLTF
ncbi:MAG: chloride channel protein, partial [Promethearchaeota archaeon]